MPGIWNALRRLVLACSIVLAAGCTFSDKLNVGPIYSSRTNGGATSGTYDVAVVTDRTTGTAAQLGFDNHWSEIVYCTSAEVKVPEATSPGAAIPPLSAAQPAEPAKCAETSYDEFTDTIAREDDKLHCPSRSVLMFVHGYNTAFRSALLRTAQMAGDAEWPCAAAAFSWGSEGQFDRYVADVERSGYAVPLLMDVLKALRTQKIATNVVAHSMGTRLTLSALGGLSSACRTDHFALVNELILAAPDVNSEKFNDDFGALLAKALPCVRHVTIYASHEDMVLMLSQSIHGGIPRAGLEPENDRGYTLDRDNVDVVDASEAPGEAFGHGYFVESYEMLDDIMMVLRGVPIATRAEAPDLVARTLVCENADTQPCAGPHDSYALEVAPGRRPDLGERILRHALARLLAIQQPIPMP